MAIYDRIKVPPTSLTYVDIVDYFPVVTDDDVTTGYIYRYFTRQSNHRAGDITEIDEHTYSKLKSNPMYQVVSLEWRISGPLDDSGPMGHTSKIGVLTANRLSLETAEAEMRGMKYRLTNLSQFWQGK